MQQLEVSYPALIQNRYVIEKHFSDLRFQLAPVPKHIPLVFHILTSTDQSQVGIEQIQSQIDALNRDFGGEELDLNLSEDVGNYNYDSVGLKHRMDFSDRSSGCQISFCLAYSDPNGQPTSGINYLSTNHKSWMLSDSINNASKGGADAWDPRHYINIWVVSLADGISGYAQMPGGPEETDGIVIDYRFFGSGGTSLFPYNEGKTLTHLVGNYLNLYELWGDEKTPCSDDYVDDTPIHNAPNYECPHLNHISTCDDNPAEMVVNFMDNTDDACMYMFTAVQGIRMQAVLSKSGWREDLSTENLANCGDSASIVTPGIDRFQNLTDGANAATESWQVMLRPNPALIAFEAVINAPASISGTLIVADNFGQIIYREKTSFDKGLQVRSFDCTNWPSGLYCMRFIGSGSAWSKTVAIAR